MKVNNGGKTKGVKLILLGAIFILGLLTILGSPNPIPDLKINENFMLAFKEKGSNNIVVRYSADGLTWKSGNFPSAATSGVASFNGVGASSERGILSLVAYPQLNSFNFVWGLGTAVWDRSKRNEPASPSKSPPSIAFTEDDKWLLAYLRGDETVTIAMFDDEQKKIILEIPIFGNLNTKVIGRPAIIYEGGKVLVTWRRYDSGWQLVVVEGSITSGIPSFSAPASVDIPVPGISGTVDSDPDITYADGKFIVAYVSEETSSGAGTLHGWKVICLQSTDGSSWTLHSTTGSLGARNDSIINIAGATNGNLVMANVKNLNQRTAGRYSVDTSGQWAWRGLDANVVFGVVPAHEQFSLVTIGRQ